MSCPNEPEFTPFPGTRGTVSLPPSLPPSLPADLYSDVLEIPLELISLTEPTKRSPGETVCARHLS